MGEIASTYPTAGGLYYWSSKLGSPGWGWFTGWFNLIGQIAVTAAIGYGCAIFMTALAEPDHVGALPELVPAGSIFTYAAVHARGWADQHVRGADHVATSTRSRRSGT